MASPCPPGTEFEGDVKRAQADLRDEANKRFHFEDCTAELLGDVSASSKAVAVDARATNTRSRQPQQNCGSE
jgi:hypothetical protein